jgi:hypothetical protein
MGGPVRSGAGAKSGGSRSAGRPGPGSARSLQGSADPRGLVRSGGGRVSPAVGDPSPGRGRSLLARAGGGPRDGLRSAPTRRDDAAARQDHLVPDVGASLGRACLVHGARARSVLVDERGRRGARRPAARSPARREHRGFCALALDLSEPRRDPPALAAGAGRLPHADQRCATHCPGTRSSAYRCRRRGPGRLGRAWAGRGGGLRGGPVAHRRLVHDGVPGVPASASRLRGRRGPEVGEGASARDPSPWDRPWAAALPA